MSAPTVIAVANMAGSAGKTTTVVTLAALLAEEGARVLVVDLDAQANASFALGVDATEAVTDPDHPETSYLVPTVADVLQRTTTLPEATVLTGVEDVLLVPASAALNGLAIELGRQVGGEQRLRLALATHPIDVDVVLIDCPGALNIYTVMALVAAHAVIAVTQPTTKELAGLPALEDTIGEVAGAYNPGIHLAAVVPCIVPANGALYRQGVQILRDSYQALVTHAVRHSVRVPEAYDTQLPLPLFAPDHPVTADYRQVLGDLRAAGALPAHAVQEQR